MFRKPRLFIAFLLLSVIMLCFTSASAEVTYGNTLYVNGQTADRVHLRVADTTSSASQGLYFTGTEVTLVRYTGTGWAQVWIGKSLGYMKTSFLTPVKPNAAQKTAVIVSNGYVNLRSIPSTNGDSLYRLRSGQQIVVLGETSGKWYYVYVPASGQTGYVMPDYVSMDDVPSAILTQSLVPFHAAEYYGAVGANCATVTIDPDAPGFLLETLYSVDWFSVDAITWIDETTPQYTPVYTQKVMTAGTQLRIRIWLPDAGTPLAITCCSGGIFESYFVIQSGENGDILLIPADAVG